MQTPIKETGHRLTECEQDERKFLHRGNRELREKRLTTAASYFPPCHEIALSVSAQAALFVWCDFYLFERTLRNAGRAAAAPGVGMPFNVFRLLCFSRSVRRRRGGAPRLRGLLGGHLRGGGVFGHVPHHPVLPGGALANRPQHHPLQPVGQPARHRAALPRRCQQDSVHRECLGSRR